jgi:hypothetical protein
MLSTIIRFFAKRIKHIDIGVSLATVTNYMKVVIL